MSDARQWSQKIIIELSEERAKHLLRVLNKTCVSSPADRGLVETIKFLLARTLKNKPEIKNGTNFSN